MRLTFHVLRFTLSSFIPLAGYLAPHRGRVVLLVALLAPGSGLQVAGPLALRDVVDAAAASRKTLYALFRNTVNLSAGVVVLPAGGAIRGGNLTVGDFALFIFYLPWVSDFTTVCGMLAASYRQANVSRRRMEELTRIG
jgi:ABC-type multidrug transport system fused ATPase/permease subunit